MANIKTIIRKNNSKIVVLSLTILALVALGLSYFQNSNQSGEIGAGMKKYENKLVGFSFMYPDTYTLTESQNAVGIMSPLSPTHPSNSADPQQDELKVEIWYSNIEKDKSLEEYAKQEKKNSIDTPDTLEKEEIIDIFGKKVYLARYAGAEVFWLIHKEKGITIVKFPPKTNRQLDSEKIFSSFEFF